MRSLTSAPALVRRSEASASAFVGAGFRLVPERCLAECDPEAAAGHRFVALDIEDLKRAGYEPEVGDRAAIPADGVEHAGILLGALAADDAPGGLQTVDAVEGGGADMRPAGLRAESKLDLTVPDRSARAGRRSAGRVAEIVEIAGRGLAAGRGKLHGVGLAEDHRPGMADHGDASGILGRAAPKMMVGPGDFKALWIREA